MSNKSNPETTTPLDIPTEFLKVTKDLVRDILITFPEYKDSLDVDLKTLVLSNDNHAEPSPETSASLIIVYEHCKRVFPERFFDILYQNSEIFANAETDTEFLPGIKFNDLWKQNISEKTRETLWKYLQLLLFTIIKNVNKESTFGDTAKLFEAINEDELKDKLADSISQMHELFGNMEGSEEGEENAENNTKPCDINPEDLPKPEEIHEHISGMLDGKLGNLAKEIAAETAEELNVDLNESANVNDVFEKMFKNPGKLMGLVQNVGKKLDTKLKSGELKQSELIEEAGELMNKMKNMPGMGNLQQMMNQMHGGKGGKLNMNAMQAKMNQNLKQAKSRERMQETLRKRREEQEAANSGSAQEFDPKTVNHTKYTDGESAEKTPINKEEGKKTNKKKKKRPKK